MKKLQIITIVILRIILVTTTLTSFVTYLLLSLSLPEESPLALLYFISGLMQIVIFTNFPTYFKLRNEKDIPWHALFVLFFNASPFLPFVVFLLLEPCQYFLTRIVKGLPKMN